MNKIKSILSLSIITMLAFLISCNSENQTSNKAVIKLNFKDYSGAQVIVKSTSPYQINGDTLNANETEAFIYNTTIDKPTYFELNIIGQRQAITVYIRPGDSVIVNTQDARTFTSTPEFGGNAPIYNDYIFKAEQVSASFNNTLMNIFKNEESQALKAIDSLRAIHADNIAALRKGNSNIDPYFLKIEEARALYGWANLHSLYPKYYNYINKLDDENGIKLSPEFDTYLAEVKLSNVDLLVLPVYTNFLKQYYQADYDLYYNTELEAEYSSYANYQLSEYNKGIENSEIKSILAYTSINDQVNYQGKKDKGTYWELFSNICTNDIFIKDIESKMEKWAHLDKGQPIKDIEMQDIDENIVSFSDFKGKWIYIDVWATWCNPCIKEIPVLKQLEEDFRGKDVVFISLSVDRQAEPWQEMVKAKELKGVQVWVGQNEIISTFYKVSGIPRFMIFDPQGNIYDANAKRPSMGAGDIISDLLKK